MIHITVTFKDDFEAFIMGNAAYTQLKPELITKALIIQGFLCFRDQHHPKTALQDLSERTDFDAILSAKLSTEESNRTEAIDDRSSLGNV